LFLPKTVCRRPRNRPRLRIIAQKGAVLSDAFSQDQLRLTEKEARFLANLASQPSGHFGPRPQSCRRSYRVLDGSCGQAARIKRSRSSM
jgi:hypothetical protein